MNKRSIGNIGEDIAIKWLVKNKNYNILDRNYSTGYGEIDIIAEDGKALVFIEVKFRNGTDFGYPYEAVNKNKQCRICKAALQYVQKKYNTADINIRFDVVEIIKKDGVYYIRYTENAFEWRE